MAGHRLKKSNASSGSGNTRFANAVEIEISSGMRSSPSSLQRKRRECEWRMANGGMQSYTLSAQTHQTYYTHGHDKRNCADLRPETERSTNTSTVRLVSSRTSTEHAHIVVFKVCASAFVHNKRSANAINNGPAARAHFVW